MLALVYRSSLFQIGDFALQPSKCVFLVSVTMILACVVTQSLSYAVIRQVSLVLCSSFAFLRQESADALSVEQHM